MNKTDEEANNGHIAPCGDDCARCPRFIAVTDEELQKLAELWHRVGWRDSVVSADDMRCGGCTLGKRCSYGILECQAKESVAKCRDCKHHPCAKIAKVLAKSDEWQRRCKEVCSPDEYAMLEPAFFRKKKNIGLSEHGFTIRRFAQDDAAAVQTIIHRGLREINGKDYPAKLIEEFCAYFSIEKILAQAASAHTYVAVSDAGGIVGTGSIAPYWGSETESILLTIYVLPERIGNGIGTAIVKALEDDDFSQRARRIEIPSSKTAVNFYRKMGYAPKDGNEEPDDEGLVRLEKYPAP